MVDLITRAQWGARPPTRPLTQVPWPQRAGVAIHYTFGHKTDTPLQLQIYAQDRLGYADGHYNLLVDYKGNAYEGRGWTVAAAHSEGENYEWIGIAFIGKDADVTPAAEATIAALCADADRLAGRKLQRAGHQELPGAQTSCPGPRLMDLVRRLASKGVPDMFLLKVRGNDAIYYSNGIHTRNMAGGLWDNTGKPLMAAGVPLLEYSDLAELFRAGGPLLPAVPVPVQLSDADRAAIIAGVVAQMPKPLTVQEIAQAVLDEDHRRSAS